MVVLYQTTVQLRSLRFRWIRTHRLPHDALGEEPDGLTDVAQVGTEECNHPAADDPRSSAWPDTTLSHSPNHIIGRKRRNADAGNTGRRAEQPQVERGAQACEQPETDRMRRKDAGKSK